MCMAGSPIVGRPHAHSEAWPDRLDVPDLVPGSEFLNDFSAPGTNLPGPKHRRLPVRTDRKAEVIGSVMNCPGDESAPPRPALEQMSGGHELGDVLLGKPGHLALDLLVANQREGVLQLLNVQAGGEPVNHSHSYCVEHLVKVPKMFRIFSDGHLKHSATCSHLILFLSC